MNYLNHYIIPGLVPDINNKMRIDDIIKTVCDEYHITPNQLKSKNKTKLREYSDMRRMIYFFLKKYTNMSLAEIGILFGKDHSTIIAGIKKINELETVGCEEIVLPKKSIEIKISKRYKTVKR